MNDKHILAVAVKRQFANAVKRGAELEMLSTSSFVRRTLAAKLKEQGIDPIGCSAASRDGSFDDRLSIS
jgi:hypothetical protein